MALPKGRDGCHTRSMDENATARMAQLFDALSETYDSTGVDFFRPIARGLVRALEPLPGDRWLDIGCGRGAVIAEVAALLEPHGGVTGIDISPQMVERSKQTFAADAHVEVLVGDAQNPDDGLGQFDVIASSLVLFFLADPDAALRNWQRRIRPGGRIGVTTFGQMDPRWEHVDSVFEPYLPPQMRDARTSGKAGPFASDAGMEQMLMQAGYHDVRTISDVIDVRFDDAEEWETFSWSVGQRAMWLAIPESERATVRDRAFSILAEYEEPDGSITLAQPVRHTLGRWLG